MVYHTRCPLDLSLTVSQVLLAVETVEDELLAGVFQILGTKEKELQHSTTAENFRRRLANYYVTVHPSASWAHVGGRLLNWKEGEAVEKVKEYIPHKKGIQNHI